MKKSVILIVVFLLCLTMILSGCKKDQAAIEAQNTIEQTEEIRKDPAATSVTVITTTQTGQDESEDQTAENEPEPGK